MQTGTLGAFLPKSEEEFKFTTAVRKAALRAGGEALAP